MKTNMINGLGPVLLVPLSAAVVSAPAVTTLLRTTERLENVPGPLGLQILTSTLCMAALTVVLVMVNRPDVRRWRNVSKWSGQ
jgi:hypothetical protein